MIPIIRSGTTTDKGNASFCQEPRRKGEQNMAWIRRNLNTEKDPVRLVLVGGVDPMAFRIRVAQSHVRHDMTPSWWSHVLLLDTIRPDVGQTTVYEISLEPRQGFGFPVPTNGVQTGKLRRYDDPAEFPNVAVLRIPSVNRSELKLALDQFQHQRATLDALDLIVQWLSYCWGVGKAGNPLLDGQGIPSAAMLDVIFAAVGFDLTPGLESRCSCPESIWQAAKWWHRYYDPDSGTKRASLKKIPYGYYCVEHAFLKESGKT